VLDALGDLACEALGLSDDTTCDRHQPAVALPHPLLSLLGAASRSAPDLDEAATGAASTIAQLGAYRAGQLGDLLHRARQHPNPVAEQRCVGRVVDVGLDDRCVHPHPAAADDLLLLGDGHHPLMDLLDNLGPQRNAELAQRLRVGHLGRADPRELSIHQVGSDLAFEHRVAPVAHVLEHQQPNHDIHRCALAPACETVRPARCQRVVDQLQQQLILEHLVDVPHPVFPKLANFLGDKAVTEIKLVTAQLEHVQAFPRALAR
jgi:hypothetical protein